MTSPFDSMFGSRDGLTKQGPTHREEMQKIISEKDSEKVLAATPLLAAIKGIDEMLSTLPDAPVPSAEEQRTEQMADDMGPRVSTKIRDMLLSQNTEPGDGRKCSNPQCQVVLSKFEVETINQAIKKYGTSAGYCTSCLIHVMNMMNDDEEG